MNTEAKERARGFGSWLIGSLCVAVAAFAGPLSDKDLFIRSSGRIVLVLLVPPCFWGILVLTGIIRYRTRGLWLLIGAPLALFWWALIYVGALHGDLP